MGADVRHLDVAPATPDCGDLMRLTSALRRTAIAALPHAWRPVASFHYYRLRALLERELPFACRGLDARSVAVDVGANEGVYTHAFARTGARVEAFEPEPTCAETLRSYARHHPNVFVHTHALGAADGWDVLVVPVQDGRPITSHARLNGAHGTRHRVPVRTLDSLALPRADVIKIDVEGRERDVVTGARDTIARCRPLLIVEIEQRHLHEPMESVFEAIVDLGYEGHFVHPTSGLQRLERFSRIALQEPANADRLGAMYVNNFLFAPRDGSRASVLPG
jgi:FkbM family methyltransferase